MKAIDENPSINSCIVDNLGHGKITSLSVEVFLLIIIHCKFILVAIEMFSPTTKKCLSWSI